MEATEASLRQALAMSGEVVTVSVYKSNTHFCETPERACEAWALVTFDSQQSAAHAVSASLTEHAEWQAKRSRTGRRTATHREHMATFCEGRREGGEPHATLCVLVSPA